MKKKNEFKKVEKGDIVEVIWLDAYGEIGVDKNDLENNPSPSSYLIETKTYGVFYTEDDKAIIILEEDSSSAVDLTAIPKPWIIDIIKLKKEVKNDR